MFNTIDLTVDAVQNGKKQFITKYINDPVLKKSWTDYVDTQTKFCHSAVQTYIDVSTTVGQKFMDTKIENMLNPFSIDWFRAGWDAYVQQNINKSTKTSAASKKAA